MYEPYGPIRRPENINPTELPTANAEKGLLVAELGRQALEMIFVNPDERQERTVLEELTERESGILILLAEGLSNIQIGQRLWVAEQTVKFHLTNIYRKLGVNNRTEAANVFLQQEGGNTGFTIENLQERERKIKEAATLLIRGGVILASVIDEPLDYPKPEESLGPTENVVQFPHPAKENVTQPKRRGRKRGEFKNGTLAGKAVSLIEQRLGEPLDLEARDALAVELYGENDGRSEAERRGTLTTLLREGPVQARLKLLGISLEKLKAREFFRDRERNANEIVYIYYKEDTQPKEGM